MFIPIGHDQSIRRLPWVTIGIMVLCVLVQLHRTIFAPWPHELEEAQTRSEVADLALVSAIERARMGPKVDSASPGSQLEAMAAQQQAVENGEGIAGVGSVTSASPSAPSPTLEAFIPGAGSMTDEQIVAAVHEGTVGSDAVVQVASARIACRELKSMLDRDLARRMAYVPTTPFSAFMVLYAFAHAGWLHLVGNLIFLWLCGCNLEDRWGPVIFWVFYLTSAWVASLAYFFLHRGDMAPLVGASGAIAGAMGAFVVVFARARIEWMWIWWMKIRRFHTPAYVALPLWFVAQLVQIVLETSAGGGGVAYSAHVGGFLFGVVAAGGMKLSGAEAKLEARRESKETTWSEHPDFLRALEIASKEPVEAMRLFTKVIADRPTHVEARIELCRLAVGQRDATAMAASLSPAITALGRAEQWMDVVDLAHQVEETKIDAPLDELAAWTVVRAAHEGNDPHLCVRAAKRLQNVAPTSGYLPRTFLYVATAQKRVGRGDLATRTLQRLLDEHPTHACATEARKQLA